MENRGAEVLDPRVSTRAWTLRQDAGQDNERTLRRGNTDTLRPAKLLQLPTSYYDQRRGNIAEKYVFIDWTSARAALETSRRGTNIVRHKIFHDSSRYGDPERPTKRSLRASSSRSTYSSDREGG